MKIWMKRNPRIFLLPTPNFCALVEIVDNAYALISTTSAILKTIKNH